MLLEVASPTIVGVKNHAFFFLVSFEYYSGFKLLAAIVFFHSIKVKLYIMLINDSLKIMVYEVIWILKFIVTPWRAWSWQSSIRSEGGNVVLIEFKLRSQTDVIRFTIGFKFSKKSINFFLPIFFCDHFANL